jgi:hypothetical protein
MLQQEKHIVCSVDQGTLERLGCIAAAAVQVRPGPGVTWLGSVMTGPSSGSCGAAGLGGCVAL